jgi:hypothetical protein
VGVVEPSDRCPDDPIDLPTDLPLGFGATADPGEGASESGEMAVYVADRRGGPSEAFSSTDRSGLNCRDELARPGAQSTAPTNVSREDGLPLIRTDRGERFPLSEVRFGVGSTRKVLRARRDPPDAFGGGMLRVGVSGSKANAARSRS